MHLVGFAIEIEECFVKKSRYIFQCRRIYFLQILALLTQYCVGHKIEKNEMGWACGAYG